MNFNDHSNLSGLHAFLGASNYHWLNYTDDKLVTTFENYKAAQRGTELHEFAANCIRLGIKLEPIPQTLNMYVNDAIGFMMVPEQVLFYSENCFGTTDAICFRNDFLRIHDYKSGKIPAHMEQLKIYNALFCLEYDVKPHDIQTELRIYQNNEILFDNPDPKEIAGIMKDIKHKDKIIRKLQKER